MRFPAFAGDATLPAASIFRNSGFGFPSDFGFRGIGFVKVIRPKTAKNVSQGHSSQALSRPLCLFPIGLHGVVTLADQAGAALRGGHHCAQPRSHGRGVESTARASFCFYNTKAEAERFVEVVKEIQKFFAQ